MQPTFQFISSYRGQFDYTMRVDGQETRICHRVFADPYEHSFYNGTAEAYERAIVAAVGTVHLYFGRIDPDHVRAFNDWRRAEHDRAIAHMRARPQLYGELGEDIVAPPHEARGVYWADGWRDVAPALATA